MIGHLSHIWICRKKEKKIFQLKNPQTNLEKLYNLTEKMDFSILFEKKKRSIFETVKIAVSYITIIN